MEDSVSSFEVKVETTEVEQYETLFIVEEGDEIHCEIDIRERADASHVCTAKSDENTEREPGENTDGVSEVRVGNDEAEVEDLAGETSMGKGSQNAEEVEKQDGVGQCDKEVNLEEVKDDGVTSVKESEKVGGDEMEEKGETREGDRETEVNRSEIGKRPDGESDREKVMGDAGEGQNAGERKMDRLKVDTMQDIHHRSKDRLASPDANTQSRRLTPDFPDTLYELLCSLQEGRRINDQRCSFRFERRCHSEPSTPVPRHRVVFSSMTSLQKEEFFELLATSQGRRLDDQRAELQDALSAPMLPPSKVNERKGSRKQAEPWEVASTPAPKEELYNMILSSQAQGRLEEQRSAAPGPMDDEDFFSLLLKVQGGRIDEQRTELPVAFKY